LIPLPHDAMNESSVRCGRAAVGTAALFVDCHDGYVEPKRWTDT